MKKLIVLLMALISLPCSANDYEVYYPSTVRIISTGFINANPSYKPGVTLDGLDGSKRVLYTVYLRGRAPDEVYSFTFVPSKNIKGKIVINRVEK